MKPLNLNLQKGVRALVFALVATISVGAALAMKPATVPPTMHKYGVTDNNDGTNWKVEAYLNLTDSYICDAQPESICTVKYESDTPLSEGQTIPKNQAQNPEPGIFSPF